MASHPTERDGSGDERLSTLLHNMNAVQAIASAVEGTIGPKGLDTMLVDEEGGVIITNDGVTILEEMEVRHPAARLMIGLARSQQREVGDGTTTATLLAAALVTEGAAQVQRGVPVAKVIAGIELGINEAVAKLKEAALPIEAFEDERLFHIAYIAGREQEDIARLVIEGAKLIGRDKMLEPDFAFSELVTAGEGAENEVLNGVIIHQRPLSREMPKRLDNVCLFVLNDALAPEEMDDEALGTEIGFQRYLQLKEEYRRNLKKLLELGVNAVVLDRSCDSMAEEFCLDHGIVVLHRVFRSERERVARYTGARSLKRIALNKSVEELSHSLGYAEHLEYDETLGQVRVIGGRGISTATMVIGASTGEVVGERERIAKDAAAAVQAALRGGYLPGGGSLELFLSRHLEEWRTSVQGMEGFGVEAVAAALRKPFAQMIRNAGFNPLEKIEQVKAAQAKADSSSIGLDFDTGHCADMLESGVVDPALVKLHALKTAGEVSRAILRIHTVIRKKSPAIPSNE
ncbi:TCP-1/cpn60 chaperonin family protein [Aneurinibacillus thermoaerophilus]|uniref:TCP-1/cpn60 chaperonin family protein n=1 Tax=Aneurinibacillus thermoaerophilus TaxID=143495 RepID=UPI002E21638E|nr:TCP-1/cpn60 chaperonin family protein [Aneurinibacillus thermoaerophilus]MED0763972.1 TCP-1/cpn60 chaperonin family protein [Aneurinibacillus thermoaerophilus]